MSKNIDAMNDLPANKRLLLAFKEMQSRLETYEKEKTEPIAIVGMACRFPGGVQNPDAFWDILHDGKDGICEFPVDRWDIEEYTHPNGSDGDTISTRWGGFLKEPIDQFDASFFGIAPREVNNMDPQQRLLLEVTWEALENAGQNADELVGSQTGVFLGISSSEYAQLQDLQQAQVDAYTGTGAAYCVAAGRIAFLLGLQGPAISVDTACSSSLVALHLACQSLRNKECDIAIGAGVNAILSPKNFAFFSKIQALAKDGRCKTFDAAADGYGRGEGCGVVVLKRLSQALAHKDPILALIRGSAMNADGRSSGLTVPNGRAQQAVIRRALAEAHMEPHMVDYIETHGTGTPLGDPIEVQAIHAVFKDDQKREQPLRLGSVKTNIGHLEAAAGIAGIIKIVLMLQHQEIPPLLNLHERNPYIAWDEMSIELPTQLQPWKKEMGPRVAGISAFGFSGTNAHIILQDASEYHPLASAPAREIEYILPLSARDPQALKELAQLYLPLFLFAPAASSLYDLFYTAALRRSHHDYRLAVVGKSREEFIDQLEAYLHGNVTPSLSTGMIIAGERPKIVFVFSGHGSQWLGMARTLLDKDPTFTQVIAECEAAFQPYVEWSLQELLRMGPDDEDAQRRLMEDVSVLQPTIFAIQVALAALWRSWGIVPDAVVGHSMGEIAAATVAGILPLAQAALLICHRARLLAQVQGKGAMLLVEMPQEQVERKLHAAGLSQVSFAISNSYRSTAISGERSVLGKLHQQWTEQGLFCRWIKTDIAFHSPQMDSLLPLLEQALQTLQPQAERLPFYSTVTTRRFSGLYCNSDYWLKNLRLPVRFGETIEHLLSEGYHTFVEVSPHPILLSAVEECLRHSERTGLVLPSLRRNEPERERLLKSLGALYSQGQPINWKAVYAKDGAVVKLPNYPWQKQRFWFEQRPEEEKKKYVQSTGRKGHPLLGLSIVPALYENVHLWHTELSIATHRYLSDHRVLGDVVLPGSAYVVMALAAATEHYKKRVIIRHMQFQKMLRVPPEGARTIQVTLTTDESVGHVKIFSQESSESQEPMQWMLHALGDVYVIEQEDVFPAPLDLASLRARCSRAIDPNVLYEQVQQHGLQYGERFRCVDTLYLSQENEAVAHLHLGQETIIEQKDYPLHPILLDAAFQVIGTILFQRTGSSIENSVYLPIALEQLRLYKEPEEEVWVYAQLKNSQENDADLFQGDIILCQADGGILCEIQGLQVKRLDASAMVPQKDALTDLLYELHWQLEPRKVPPAEQHKEQSAERGYWLLFTDAQGVGASIKAQLEAAGEYVIQIRPGTKYRNMGADTYEVAPRQPQEFRQLLKEALLGEQTVCHGIVYLWGIDSVADRELSSQSMEQTATLYCAGLLHLIQALLSQARWRNAPQLSLVTMNTHSVEGTILQLAEQTSAQAPLWGLVRVIGHEQSQLRPVCIDLSSTRNDSELAALLEEIRRPDQENQIALRNDERYVLRLQAARGKKMQEPDPLQYNGAGERQLLLNPQATYMITGGLGDLGMLTAAWLIEQGAQHVALLGRHEPGDQMLQTLKTMSGEHAHIYCYQADVADSQQLNSVLTKIKREAPPLKGIIHAAGSIDDGILTQQTQERFQHVMAPKVGGALNLHHLTAGWNLDFMIYYSSATSVLGGPGQGNYAAANAFLDTMASYRSQQNLPTLSVNWGPWTNIGMASASGKQDNRLAFRGLSGISAKEGFAALEWLLRKKQTQMTVMPFDIRRWSQFYPKVGEMPLLRNILPSQKKPAGEKGNEDVGYMQRKLSQIEQQQRQSSLENHLRDQIAYVLQRNANSIHFYDSLGKLGFDSLMALELRNRLEISLNISLPATLVWAHPNIPAMAIFLLDEMRLSVQEESKERIDNDATIMSMLQAIESDTALDGDTISATEEVQKPSDDSFLATLLTEIASIEGE